MNDNNLEIPPNATIRQAYVKCGDPDCQTEHGPYLYAYWKQDKKLKKRYVGKNFEDFVIRRIAKEIKLPTAQVTKHVIGVLSPTGSRFYALSGCYSFPNPSSFPFPNDLRRNPMNIKTPARVIATMVSPF